MRSLSRLLSPERIVYLSAGNSHAVLTELASAHYRFDQTVPLKECVEALVEREELGSTAIGAGLALPHARLQKLSAFSLVLGIHPEGIEFAAFDNEPVRIFALMLGPAGQDDLYVHLLGRISRFLRDNRQTLLSGAGAGEIYQLTLRY